MFIEVVEIKDREDGGADIIFDLDKEAVQLLISSAIRTALMKSIKASLSDQDNL